MSINFKTYNWSWLHANDASNNYMCFVVEEFR